MAAMRIAELQRVYSRHNSTADFSLEEKLFWALAQMNKRLVEENLFMSAALNPNEEMAKLAEEHEAARLEAEERYRLLADELQKRGCPSRVPAEIVAWIDQKMG